MTTTGTPVRGHRLDRAQHVGRRDPAGQRLLDRLLDHRAVHAPGRSTAGRPRPRRRRPRPSPCNVDAPARREPGRQVADQRGPALGAGRGEGCSTSRRRSRWSAVRQDARTSGRRCPCPCRRGRTGSDQHDLLRPELAGQLERAGHRVRGLDRRDDALGPARAAANASIASRVGDRPVRGPAGVVQPGVLRADARGSRARPRSSATRMVWPVRVLQQVASGCRAARRARRPLIVAACRAGLDAARRRPRTRPADAGVGTNAVKMPIALEPPPTQATTASGSRPVRSSTCARASSPITRWKSRTIIGNGCGPATEPIR